MWTIVSFDDEKAVEAVPAHWVKNNLCAWPKKEIKKHIIRRTIPNKFDFNYFKSRVLKKDIGTLREAREKVKIAEDTSDLSNIENTSRQKHTKNKIVEPPQYFEKLNENEQNDDLDLFSPDIVQETSPNYNINHELNYIYKESFGSKFSNKDYKTIQMSECPSVNVKRALFKPINTSTQGNKSSSASPETIVYTSSSPFKVTSQDNYKSLISAVQGEMVLSDYTNTQQHDHNKPSTSTKHYNNNDSEIKNRLPTSYSSTKYNRYNVENRKNIDEVSQQRNLGITPRGTSSSDQHSDILNRILNVVLKIRYDVQSIQQKQMEMEQTLEDAIHKINETKSSTHQNISAEGEDFYLMIPIMNEEQLFIFEEKLLEKSYKSSVVNELKRLQKKELNSTVRGLLKALFSDDVLKEYSYVGQKKKKIFCTLKS